jgi:transcription initiation factor TFIID subunit 1
MGVTGDVFLPGGKKVKNETTVSLELSARMCVDVADVGLWLVPQRRCGNCGQIGHMKTNRKCPKWAVSLCPSHLTRGQR